MLNGMRERSRGGAPFFVYNLGLRGRGRGRGWAEEKGLRGQGVKKRQGEEREGLDTAISI